MNSINVKFIAAILGAAVVAGTSTYLVEQHKANQLRAENQNLQAEQQRLSSERDSSRSAAKELNDELGKTQTDKSELLRLRGQLGLLRNQLVELEKLRAENRQLRASLDKLDGKPPSDNTDPDVTYTRQRMRDAKTLVAALMGYADKHNDQFPTSFDQAVPYLGRALRNELNAGEPLRDLDNFVQVTNQFDIVYQGKWNAITNFNDAIVLREKQATQTPQGKWVKTYGFADGHSEIRPEPDEGFEAWERQHMPQTSGGAQ